MTPVQRRADARAVGYIRRSQEKHKAEDRDNGAGQRAAIAALAAARGETVAPADIEARDWNISGQREKREKRQGMADILAGIRAGEVSALYAYSVDRLARDDAYGLDIRDACEDAGVLILTKIDGPFNFADDLYRDYWGRKVTEAANAGRKYTAVNLDNKVEQRRHIAEAEADPSHLPGRPHAGQCDARCIPGEHCSWKHDLGGRKPYGADPDHSKEDVAAVVAAYREAEYSFSAATRLLNLAGTVPTRLGGLWTQRAVSNVVRAANVPQAERAPMPRERVSAKRTHVFSGLLVCRCGRTLTTHTRRDWHKDRSRGPMSVAYRCLVGSHGGHPRNDHGPLMIAESKVRAWAMVEVQRTGSLTPKAVERQADASAALIERKMAALDAKLDAGRITPDAYRRDMAALRAKSTAVEDIKSAGYTLRLGIDWSGAPAEVNARLRSLWHAVRLGPDMLPVSADWIVAPLDDDEVDMSGLTSDELKARGRRGDPA